VRLANVFGLFLAKAQCGLLHSLLMVPWSPQLAWMVLHACGAAKAVSVCAHFKDILADSGRLSSRLTALSLSQHLMMALQDSGVAKVATV
jgi:hypothetical protein